MTLNKKKKSIEWVFECVKKKKSMMYRIDMTMKATSNV